MFCCGGGTPLDNEEYARMKSQRPINRKKQKKTGNKKTKSIISSTSESVIIPILTDNSNSLIDTYNNPQFKNSITSFGSDYEKDFCNGGGSPDINLHNDSLTKLLKRKSKKESRDVLKSLQEI